MGGASFYQVCISMKKFGLCASACFLLKKGMKRFLMKGNRGLEEVRKPAGWWVGKGGTAEGAEEEETKDDGWSPLCHGGWVSEDGERGSETESKGEKDGEKERKRERERERERERGVLAVGMI